MKKNWYILYTKIKCERKVSYLLTKRKINNYVPLNKVFKETSNEMKMYKLEPLFNSYVFVNITENELSQVKQTTDVINIVFWLSRPVVISDVEIFQLQSFLNDYDEIKLEKTQVSINNRFKDSSANLYSYLEEQNHLNNINKARIKISLPALGYIISADSSLSTFETLDQCLQLEERTFNLTK